MLLDSSNMNVIYINQKYIAHFSLINCFVFHSKSLGMYNSDRRKNSLETGSVATWMDSHHQRLQLLKYYRLTPQALFTKEATIQVLKQNC